MAEPDIKTVAHDFGIPADTIRNIDPASPPAVRMMAAAGTLPVPPRVLMSVLYVLMGDPDQAVAGTARTTLLGMPAGLLVKNIDPTTHPRVLEFLAFHRTEEPLLEVISLRRQANDKTLCYLAQTAPAMIVEIIAGNQERTLVTPTIVQHLAANPSCTRALLDKVRSWQRMNGIVLADTAPSSAPTLAARSTPAGTDTSGIDEASIDETMLAEAMGEIDEQFRDEPSMGEPSLTPPPPLIQGDDPLMLLLQAMGIDARPEYFEASAVTPIRYIDEANEDLQRKVDRDSIDVARDDIGATGLQPLSGMSFEFRLDRMDDDWDMSLVMDHGDDIDDELRAGIAKTIAAMTVGQKIKLAYVGNKEVRDILIRDSNKMVNAAVVKSGRLTDPEVARIASNRGISEEVLRLVAQNKEWMRSYPIKVALVNNPKCPVGTAMTFLNHLHPKDLKLLASNRNVSSVIFSTARKKMQSRGK